MRATTPHQLVVFLLLSLTLFLLPYFGSCQPLPPPPPPTPSRDDRPRPGLWQFENVYNDRRAFKFLDWLIGGCPVTENSCMLQDTEEPEYPGFDGWYNNLAKPEQGAVDTPLLRLLPPAYADGVYQPVNRSANPFTVSRTLMQGQNGETSTSGKTAFLVFFGQQVVEEVLDAQGAGCPPEYFNIQAPEGEDVTDLPPGHSNIREMPFLRTRYDMRTGFAPNNPRQQLNEITPYLDGGLVYGTGKGWADVLRFLSNGELAPHGQLAWHDELGPTFPARNVQRLPMANPPPPSKHTDWVRLGHTANVNRFFKLGNPRGNENPFLLTFGVLWFRWHNTIARYLHRRFPEWSDERLFNEARKWVVGVQQSIVLYDWLPKWLSVEPSEYRGYDVAVDPQISHVFQSAAMRFGHTLVPSGVYLRNRANDGCQTVDFNFVNGGNRKSKGVRTCNSFWRPHELFTQGLGSRENFERFLMGMSSQTTEKEDNVIVEDLRGRVFGPLEFSRRDLMAINLQRGRDHGLPDYNTARKFFKLKPLMSFAPSHFKRETGSLVPDDVLTNLGNVYNNDPNTADVWAAGLLETRRGPGQLFTRIIKDQFERIRDGDRFWFENENNHLFSSEEIVRLKQIRIIDLVLSVSDLTLRDIQEDPFTAIYISNKPVDFDSSACSGQITHTVDCKLKRGDQEEDHRCSYLTPLGGSLLEECTPFGTYDYFRGSKVSYILTFVCIGLAVVALVCALMAGSILRQKEKTSQHRRNVKIVEGTFKARERVSGIESRHVIVHPIVPKSSIEVQDLFGTVLRVLDFSLVKEATVRHTSDYIRVIVQIKNHYDLYLIFQVTELGKQFYAKVEEICKNQGIFFTTSVESWFLIQRNITTVNDRRKNIDRMCRYVLNKAFAEGDDSSSIWKAEGKENQDIFKIQMTQSELAEELGMTTDSFIFIRLFEQIDKDKDGFVTLKEFWSLMVTFAKGTSEEKADLLFKIYDLDESGEICVNELKTFFKSALGSEGKGYDLDNIVKTAMESLNLHHTQCINREDFARLFATQGDVFQKLRIDATHNVASRKETRFSLYGSLPNQQPQTPNQEEEETPPEEDQVDLENVTDGTKKEWQKSLMSVMRKIYNKQTLIFWALLYTLVMFWVFAERAYYYSVEREHAGLRRIAGYGVTVTRGAASAMMFTFSSLLVTMCRNTFSYLRESFLHPYFPFDYMIDLHRYFAFWALFWSVIHTIGHAINFYHISTQTASDLTCLFRNFFRSTHVLPKFHYWCWETVTGLTGVALVLQAALIYIFALPIARRNFFRLFWITHNSYPIFYFLILLHGSGQLVQPPFFHFFFLGPCVLFVLDKLYSISRNKFKIEVVKVHHLPSNVTMMEIKRSTSFSYLSGQWIRIASLGISDLEYHPFTLSSAPHEPNLTLHIRGVGPWTNKLRTVYPDYESIKNDKDFRYHPVYIDGPYGEGHQSWGNYEVAVFVGGGIGVTPFASILKDLIYKTQSPTYVLKTKKIYFLWVTRSQKQFEWLTDILCEVEKMDKRNIVRNHIFITAFKSKFDFRTITLYLAERHFQKISGTSLFTGLRGITHFGRPNFSLVFEAIRRKYSVDIVGVFTCGNPSLSYAVEKGCREMNNKPKGTIFRHYYENF
ncbi:dual oxidase 2-like [Oratosquilla oratoria]|uniref:dual oxidase 2-like n=1 Tax=Oratosquilla oratoria TaxID=337810 RepID=UPI003F776DF4